MAEHQQNTQTQNCSQNRVSHTDSPPSDTNSHECAHTPIMTKMCENRDPAERKFHWPDGVVVLISLAAYLIDIVTDILVGIQYAKNRDYLWAAMTFALVAVPSAIVQAFSLRWYHTDGKARRCKIWVFHVFQMQPLERYIQALIAGYHAHKSQEAGDIDEYYAQQNDLCMLRLFEAFLESAPQLTLQVYIMMCTEDHNWLTGTAAIVSLVSLGWAVAAYSNAMRQANVEDYRTHWPALVLQTLWHIGVVSARGLALVVFSSVYKAWVFLFIGLHWLVMTGWIALQKTDFCSSCCEESCFNAVVGVIYIFCYFNVKDGKTRWRVIAFYTIAFTENCLLLGLWLLNILSHGQWDLSVLQWYHLMIAGAVCGSFFVGILCMLIYYRFCHPSGPIYCCCFTGSASYTPTKETIKTHISDAHMQLPYPPKYTSTAQLPRRTLKPNPSTVEVNCREVDLLATPMSPEYRRTTDSSWYMHYTIDSSAGFYNTPGKSLGHTPFTTPGKSLGSTPVKLEAAEGTPVAPLAEEELNVISLSDLEDIEQTPLRLVGAQRRLDLYKIDGK